MIYVNRYRVGPLSVQLPNLYIYMYSVWDNIIMTTIIILNACDLAYTFRT